MTQDTEDVVARLRVQARHEETASKMMADAKTARQTDREDAWTDAGYSWTTAEQTASWRAADLIQFLSDHIDVTELDANGEAMMCEGCGTTKTLAAILAKHGPQSIACCPERKMVEARYFWNRAALHQEATVSER